MRPPRRRHTVVLSDVHLSQTHPRDDADPLWMRYRWSDYHPDAELEALIDRLLEECGDDPIELVFNGDVFDFDAPIVRNKAPSFEEYPLDGRGCATQVEHIVDDHPGFFRAVAKLVAHGHRAVFVSGNHDVELYWPEVRKVLRKKLRAALTDQTMVISDEDVEERVCFRTWFHITPDRIYLEHGSQYDMINGVADPMLPLMGDESSIHPICGKLVFKRVGARLGYFNPYCEDTFYMSVFDYLSHFFKFYAFAKRHIARTWAVGAIATALDIAKHRKSREASKTLTEKSIERAIEETQASRAAILETHALRVPSAEQTMFPILRELWIDRAVLFLLSLAIAVTCFVFTSTTTAIIVTVILLALFVVYELVSPKPDVRTYDSAPPRVEQIYEIHNVRGLCMGHTHRPFGIWQKDDSRFRGNSGTWCPAFTDRECTKPVLHGRPFLWLSTAANEAGEESEGVLFWGGLHWFRDGAITRDAEGCKRLEKSGREPEANVSKAANVSGR